MTLNRLFHEHLDFSQGFGLCEAALESRYFCPVSSFSGWVDFHRIIYYFHIMYHIILNVHLATGRHEPMSFTKDPT